MRSLEISAGGKTYTFPMYKGCIGICVKVHQYAEPHYLPDDLRHRFRALPEITQNKLLVEAWDRTQEIWWENVRDSTGIDIGHIEQQGRQGGYLTLTDWSESKLMDYETDAEAMGCETCPNAQCLEVTWQTHRRSLSDHSAGQLPLPLPAESVDGYSLPSEVQTCATCGEEYTDHLGYRCPSHLGELYVPHAYTNRAIQVLDALEGFVEYVAKRVSREAVAAELQEALRYLVANYFDDLDWQIRHGYATGEASKS